MRPQDFSALGFSIGSTNLAVARSGRPPIVRRSVLTLRNGRPAEVGVPAQDPELTSPNLTQAGVVLQGFVERVGDPVPLVGPDGSAYPGEILLTTALEALARAATGGRVTGPTAVAAPAHWGAGTIGALRGALRESPELSPGGVAPTIVSDAAAALAALQASPGLPRAGVVALCDFGGSGSSVTLADAGANLAPIGTTVRFTDFSGDQIDQAVLRSVLAGIRTAGAADTAGTAAVGALTRLREECRLAKERLSTETATVVAVDLPGYRHEVRITRGELDSLIAGPLAGFLDALADALEYNRIPVANLAAIATVGGGAAIPVVSQQLSEALRVPVITGPDPELAAATGAVLLAARGAPSDTPTGIAPAAPDAPTSLAPTAWASGAAGRAATESASEGSTSATFRALAWSQDDSAAQEPVPYAEDDRGAGGDYRTDWAAAPPPMAEFGPRHPDAVAAAPAPPPWYRRPPLLVGIAAAVAAVTVGGLAMTLTGTDSTPTTTTTRVTKPGENPATATSPAPPPVPVITTVTGGNGEPTVTTVTVAPTSSASTPQPTTTAQPLTSTTTPTPTTTTTTPTTTTTTPTTTTTTTPTTTTTTTPTTTTPTTTSAPPPTTSAPPPTTEPPTTAAPLSTSEAPPATTAAPLVTTTVPPLPSTDEPAVTTQAVVPDEPAPTTAPAPLE